MTTIHSDVKQLSYLISKISEDGTNPNLLVELFFIETVNDISELSVFKVSLWKKKT